MSTFLLVWNPKRWLWNENELDKQAKRVRVGADVKDRWSCGRTKKIKEGDRIFLIRLGLEPRGIFASGIVTIAPYLDLHWQDERAAMGGKALYIKFRYDALLVPEKEAILGREFLINDPRTSKMHWDTQSSGIQIPDGIAEELEHIWSEFLGEDGFTLPEELDDDVATFIEGAKKTVLINAYERKAEARQKCIDYHGAKCAACGFDFEATYGPIGKGYIHVHHVVPLFEIQQSYEVDPIKDLIPVCPNCHAMVHKRKKPFTIEEIRGLLNK